MPELYERDHHVQALLAAAAAGRGSVAVVTGEAGIGKTSVVRAFLDRLPPDVRTLWGACDDLLAPPALGPFRDAFRGTGGPMEEALATGDTDAVFDALTTELAQQVTVLVVEDVHWADDATLDVLRYAARRLDRFRAVLVLTFRDDAVDARHPLRTLLGSLTDGRTRRMALEPLSRDAVRSLAGARDAEELYNLTLGNPFFLTEALAGPGSAVPATVVDAVLMRARSLGSQCLEVVEQLSVVPSHSGLDFAERLLGNRTDDLARAEQHGVLSLHPDGIGFRHEIARRAIEQSLPVLRRRALNRNLVELLLTEHDPDLSCLVHHAVEANDIDTIVDFAPRAARQAAGAGSHRQALAHLEAVLPYRDRLSITQQAELLDDYAWELHIAHRFAAAVDAGRQAIGLREAVGDPVPLVETLLRVSRHLYMAGDTESAISAIDRASEAASSSGPAPVRAAAAAYRAMIRALSGCPGDAADALIDARVMAEEVGRTDLAALCLNYLGVTLADAGDPRGVRHLRDSLRTALANADHESAARAYTNLAEVLFRQGHTEQLRECLEDGLEFTRERGFWSHSYNLEVHRAQLSLRLGDWSAAEQTLRQLLDDVDDPGMLYVYSVPVYARLLARRGDFDTARSLFATSMQRALRQLSLCGILYSAIGYAEWCWLTGSQNVAEEIYANIAGYAVPPGLVHIVGELYRYLARAGVEVPADTLGSTLRNVDPYERALQLADSGKAEPMLESLRILDDLGATAAASLVRRRLRELGVRRIPRGTQSTTRNNPAGLTARQLDVLVLLAEGLTNAEIASRLVVSVRTVDHHVSAILGKLGAQSRREAAATADSLGVA